MEVSEKVMEASGKVMEASRKVMESPGKLMEVSGKSILKKMIFQTFSNFFIFFHFLGLFYYIKALELFGCRLSLAYTMIVQW